MARRIKQGLEYMPTDVFMFEDDKFRYIESKTGPLGSYSMFRLLLATFSVGLCYRWNDFEKEVFAGRIGVPVEKTEEALEAAFTANLFDRRLYESEGVLSSKGIQRRYFLGISRRKGIAVKAKYLLIKEIPDSVEIVNSEDVNTSTVKVDLCKQKSNSTPENATEIDKTYNIKHKTHNTEHKTQNTKKGPVSSPDSTEGEKAPPKKRKTKKQKLADEVETLFENRSGKWLEPKYTQALRDWIKHRDEKGAPLTPLQLEKLLRKYATDPEHFSEAVEYTITELGWQRLKHPDDDGKKGGKFKKKSQLEKNLDVVKYFEEAGQ